LDDVDDEVRDRAALYLKVFKTQTLVEPYIKEGEFIFSRQFRSHLLSFRLGVVIGCLGIETGILR
jgi:coatomer protein complex subunit gamma